MGWGALSAAQRIVVRLDLLGTREYAEKMAVPTRANLRLAESNALVGNSAVKAARNMSFMENQARFTARRGLFYMTLAAGITTASVIRMGFAFTNTMQEATVALKPMFRDTKALNAELNKLYSIAALTPFQFKDIVLGFTQMLKAGTESAPKITSTIQAVSDILSSTPGRATAANLNRVTTAISHMLTLGHVTGQMRLQLARLGIPLDYILRKTLGATDAQLNDIANSGITATQVLNSLIIASKRLPRFKDQAMLTQLNTLSGAWSSFKDFLSQASSSSTGGMFDRLFTGLQHVDKALGDISKTGKKLTMFDVIRQLNREFTPKTNIILNTFILLTSAIKGFVGALYLILWPIRMVAWGLNRLGHFLHVDNLAVKALGITMGVSLAIWAAWRGAAIAGSLAVDMAKISILGFRRAIILVMGAQGLRGLIKRWIEWAFAMKTVDRVPAWKTISGNRMSGQAYVKGFFRTLSRGIINATRAMWGFAASLWGSTAAATALDIALGPVGVVAAIILIVAVLVILYFKWKGFHDLVNRTYFWFKNHSYVALMIPFVGVLFWCVLHAKQLWHWLQKIYDIAKKIVSPFKWIFGHHGGGPNTTLSGGRQPAIARGNTPMTGVGPQFYLPGQFKGAQEGGSLVRGGTVLVGEGGPEIVSLPAAAQITPLTNRGNPLGWEMPKELNLKVILRVDGKDLAETVAKHRLDRQARR